MAPVSHGGEGDGLDVRIAEWPRDERLVQGFFPSPREVGHVPDLRQRYDDDNAMVIIVHTGQRELGVALLRASPGGDCVIDDWRIRPEACAASVMERVIRFAQVLARECDCRNPIRVSTEETKVEMPGFRNDYINVGEVSIAYSIGGNGPPLLLLHGFPQNRAMWTKVAPILAQHYTVVCADLRGYGDSGKPKGLPDNDNYSFRTFAQDQRALMQKLGFERFHLIGHDRGGRTGHRMALDHPDNVLTLTVMDIVPTHAMFMDTNRLVAASYWHWYFLQQPAPFPEQMIGANPDLFYETCLLGWGATRVSDFDPAMLAAYRASWRKPDMIHGSCCDYRAGASIDLQHDSSDIGTKVACPTLVFYGANGAMGKLFDIPAEWRKRCVDTEPVSLPGGHFFVDQFPAETAAILLGLLRKHT
ncbi:alpha/beta fold hydrolase [Herbaspirillum sp. NPDC087042]|uniref:alpha/beta fold hydrolase n=1 Tax=Herbaspirillum sp. NPDC087042 TaxID=3364004 RepID=UPI0037F9E6EC